MVKNILINEIFPDPVGADKGYEWLEIVNTSDSEINLSNWEIQVAGVRYNRAFKFPNESKIPPNAYILICENSVENCDYYTSQIGMQNGRSKTDGVRILNHNAEIIDTVLYGKPNINLLENDLKEVETDSNILLMPPEGYSIARKNFFDSEISIIDFFTTNSPTPKSENNYIENFKIIISEISKTYIEFYTPNPPDNISNWYIFANNEKIYLENNLKENFFVLETENPEKSVQLYSPENVLIDSFFYEKLSTNYTFCRTELNSQEKFQPCEFTKGQFNLKKQWEAKNVLEIIQIAKSEDYIIEGCFVYSYKNIDIFSDLTFALPVNCKNCEEKKCHISEIIFDKTSVSEIYVLEEKDFEIEIPFLNKENEKEFLNKVVKIEGEYLKKENDYCYFLTDLGILRIKDEDFLENRYVFQGIFNKTADSVFELTYPIILKQESLEKKTVLENTGSSFNTFLFILILIVLICFLGPIIRRKNK